MSRHDEIKASYKELGKLSNFYDGIITRSTLSGKIMDSVIWGLNDKLAAKWVEDALSPIPGDFKGSLLEVPVGTGVLTMPLYKSLPEAKVTCLDYSEDMMASASKRAEAMGIDNISFIQGDDDPAPTDGDDNKPVKTGDPTDLATPIILMAAAMLAILGMGLKKKH